MSNIKVYIQAIQQSEEVDCDAQEVQEVQTTKNNICIRVKNTETHDEFQGESFLHPKYLEKVHKWVKKEKY